MNILSHAAIPFIAMWKYDPNNLKGIKNSEDNKIIMKSSPIEICPFLNSINATIVPSAAPPKAIRSIIFMELSCILKTFIVTFLKLSASSFIFLCLISSILNTFNVVNPCRFSKNVSPKSA